MAILKCATAAGRAGLLDQVCLAQIVQAAFDVVAFPVQGPYALIVDTLDLGLEVARPALVHGSYTATPGAMPADLRLRIDGFSPAQPLRVDALWRGALIARQMWQDDSIIAAGGGFTPQNIDRAIIADLGALPASPAALEAERRRRLLVRLRLNAMVPNAIDDAALGQMFATAGVADAASLLAARGNAELGAFRISFSAAAAAPPVPVSLPVTVAVLARDAPLQLSALLAESRSIRAALADDPSVQPAAAAIRRRTPILVLWTIPATLLDDPDWPGADRPARRVAAADLLAGQGIALAPA